MLTLKARIDSLATRIGNYLRDSVLPRLLPTGGTTGQVLAKLSATNYAVGWANDATSGLPIYFKRLAVAHANSTVTPTTVTDGTNAWSQAVVAGKSYRLMVVANYQAVALTTGAKLQIFGSGGVAGTIAGSATGAIVQATGATGLAATIFNFAGAVGSFILTTAVNPINSPHDIGMDVVFNCTTAGTLSIQFASEVAASAAQLNIGSAFIVEELS